MSVEIWLNPACSKCRTAVSELDASRSSGVRRPAATSTAHPRAIRAADVMARLGLDGTSRAPRRPRTRASTSPASAASRRLAALAATRARSSVRSSPPPGRHHRRRPSTRRPRTASEPRRTGWPTRPPGPPWCSGSAVSTPAGRSIVGPGILAGFHRHRVVPPRARVRRAGPVHGAGRGRDPPDRRVRRRRPHRAARRVGHRGAARPRPPGPPPSRPRGGRGRGVRPGASCAVARQPVRHRRRADPRPAGRERPARGVHGAGGQAARRGDLGCRRRPDRAVRDRAGGRVRTRRRDRATGLAARRRLVR